jgi:hypothetical protein
MFPLTLLAATLLASALPLLPRYLISFTVGEDYALCHTCPKRTCPIVERYPFNSTVLLQCWVETNNTGPAPVGEPQAYMMSTDFCYVSVDDFWESLYDRMFCFYVSE